MNIYRNMLAHAGKIQIAFEAPGEGTPAAATPDALAAAAIASAAAAVTPAADTTPVTPAAETTPADTTPPATDAEKAALLREVMDKKTKLKEAQDTLALYKGVDPAKVAALLKVEADAETASAIAAGDFERVKAMMAEAHKTETERLVAEIAALKDADTAKATLIDTLTIGNDFGTSMFIKDTLTLSPAKARAVYGAHFEIQDGRTVAFDKPAGSAARTLMVDASGSPLSFDAAFAKIIDADPDKASLTKAKTLPGSSSTTTSAPGTQTPKVVDNGLRGAARIVANIKDL